MLEALLIERFHLVSHRETRLLQGFNLVSIRGKSRLKPSSESGSSESTPVDGPPKTDPNAYPQLSSPGLVMMEGAKAGES